MSTVKECDYRNVALASIRSFAVVRAVITYVYWLGVLAGSVSTDQQEKKERRHRVGRIMDPETANSIRLPVSVPRDRSARDMTI